MSLGCWLRTTTASGKCVFGVNEVFNGSATTGDRVIYVNTSGYAAGYIYSGGAVRVEDTKAINDGMWHLIILVIVAGVGLYLYVDGQLVASTLGAYTAYTSYVTSFLVMATNGVIAGGTGPTSGWIVADIEQCFALSRALTSIEAEQLWDEPYIGIDDFRPVHRRVGDATVVVQILRPDADVTDGTWTTESGGSNLFASIDEQVASDTDYIQSAVTPVNDECEVSLGNPPGPIIAPFKVRYRYKKTIGQQINLVVKLVQGTTVIATWTHNDISTSIVQATQTLTGGEAANVTDPSDLRLRFSANAP
jgi:hypothetical protein